LPWPSVFVLGEAIQQLPKPLGQPLLNAKNRQSTQMTPHRLIRELAA
jgi:hypothetical protein